MGLCPCGAAGMCTVGGLAWDKGGEIPSGGVPEKCIDESGDALEDRGGVGLKPWCELRKLAAKDDALWGVCVGEPV